MAGESINFRDPIIIMCGALGERKMRGRIFRTEFTILFHVFTLLQRGNMVET